MIALSLGSVDDPFSRLAEFDRSPAHVVLVGEMAVGKTTTGALLASLLELAHLDSDRMLEESVGTNAARYGELFGTAALHRLELELFLEALRAPGRAVISAAASVVDDEEGRNAMLGHFVVWLHANPAVRAGRAQSGSHRRPLTAHAAATLHQTRTGFYRELSSLDFDTAEISPEAIALEISEFLRGPASRPGE